MSSLEQCRLLPSHAGQDYQTAPTPLQHILAEGSVLRSGNRVRIEVRLVDAAKDQSVWSGSYSGELEDVLVLQSKVAATIAGEIHVTLTASDHARISRHRRVNLAAYDAYLKGRHLYL